MATNKTIPNPLPPGAEQLAVVEDVTGQIESISRTSDGPTNGEQPRRARLEEIKGSLRRSDLAGCQAQARARRSASVGGPISFAPGSMSAFGGKADMPFCTANVRF